MNIRRDSDLLEAAQLALTNTQKHPEIQKRMAAYGFTPAQLRVGKKLLTTVEEKQLAQGRAQDERWALSQQVNAGLVSVRDQLKQHAVIAQVAFRRDPVLLYSLKISQIAALRWDMVRQAVYFYQQLENKKVDMVAYGVSQKELEQAQTAAVALLRMKEERTSAKAMAQISTRQKHEAQRALRQWLSEFRSIARLALKDQPQMLEVFGITVIAKV